MVHAGGAGTGGGRGGGLGPGPALAQGLKLTWWEHANPPHNEYSKDLVGRYHRAQNKVQVSYEVFPMTPYFKKITVAMSTKTGPDMFTVMDPLMPTFIDKKMHGAAEYAGAGPRLAGRDEEEVSARGAERATRPRASSTRCPSCRAR